MEAENGREFDPAPSKQVPQAFAFSFSFFERKSLCGLGDHAQRVANKFLIFELLAKVRNLPFDRLRVNGLRLKLFSFSVRGELVEAQKILLQEAHFCLLFFFLFLAKLFHNLNSFPGFSV